MHDLTKEQSRLLTLKEAMAHLGVRRTTMNKLLRNRELSKVKIYGAMRIPENSVLAYIKRNIVPSRKERSR
jgi:excisionase family DNA binding protein